jgi:hypothetical protein
MGLLLAAIACSGGCGKKGAPLAPIIRIPAPVETIAAARLGHDVYVTLTVPSTNIDKSPRADLSRIDVYGYTGTKAPTPARWAELGTIVASIPVVSPPPPGESPADPAVTVTTEGALQGASVTVLDHLDPEDLVQGKVAPVDPRRPGLVPIAALTIPAPTVLHRFYLAIPFTSRGRPGPPGAQTDFVLSALPDPPTDVRASYTAGSVALAWEPAGGLLGFLLDKPLPPEPVPLDLPLAGAAPAAAPVEDAAVPPGPTTYDVYRELAPDVFALPRPRTETTWGSPRPLPLNPVPLPTPALVDVPQFGRKHCYAVRARRGTVISVPSSPTCITPVDIFPPAQPVGLAAVPSEGGISLIWEPNGDADLGGYLVLRREPGDATLRQLTDTPIRDARYRDTTVKPGSRYIYSVVAVDTQLPLPNLSAESPLVEEVAR